MRLCVNSKAMQVKVQREKESCNGTIVTKMEQWKKIVTCCDLEDICYIPVFSSSYPSSNGVDHLMWGLSCEYTIITSYKKNISYIVVEQKKKEATYPFSCHPCSSGVDMPSSRAISWLYIMGLVMSNPWSILRSLGRRSRAVRRHRIDGSTASVWRLP